MVWDVSSGPGVTALGLAAARSVESGRPDRLVEDPFARGLFEAADAQLPMLVDWPEPGRPVSDAQALHLHGSRYIGLRTRFYDDTLLAAVGDGAVQGVLFGAGLDTRAFRLGLPAGFELFELDQPGVLEFKDAILGAQGVEARCRRAAIGIDLRDDWLGALRSRGFEQSRSTVWIAEGLIPYLAPDAQAGLLTAIGELAAPGSTLALDRITGDPTAGDRLGRLSERSGIDMESLLAKGQGHDLAALLKETGWEVTEESTTALADRYGRDLSDPFGAAISGPEVPEPPWLDTAFLTARPSA